MCMLYSGPVNFQCTTGLPMHIAKWLVGLPVNYMVASSTPALVTRNKYVKWSNTVRMPPMIDAATHGQLTGYSHAWSEGNMFEVYRVWGLSYVPT